jgi:16S rRNA (guanine966-N2)-methyltransferase
MLRIVGGSRGGRRLKVPPGDLVRPTSEKVREAIFDVLGPVDGLVVLDLFAGSGALGLEALSRGAARCMFVESDRKVCAVLKTNIATLGFEEAADVLPIPFGRALERLSGAGERFDLLFVDPPYRILPQVEVVTACYLRSLLSNHGVAVIEGPKPFSPSFGQQVVFDRVYGDTRVTMLRRLLRDGASSLERVGYAPGEDADSARGGATAAPEDEA